MSDEMKDGERWAKNLTKVGAVGCGDEDPLVEVRHLLREHSKLEGDLARVTAERDNRNTLWDLAVEENAAVFAELEASVNENARLRERLEFYDPDWDARSEAT